MLWKALEAFVKNKRRCDYKSTLYVCIASVYKSDATSSRHCHIVSCVIYTSFGVGFFVDLMLQPRWQGCFINKLCCVNYFSKYSYIIDWTIFSSILREVSGLSICFGKIPCKYTNYLSITVLVHHIFALP